MKESTIQSDICNYLSMISRQSKFIYFSVPNESLMMVLKIFKIPKATCFKILAFFKRIGLLPGVADIIIIHNGLAYGIEVKTDTGKQSDVQKIFEQRMIESGGKYSIVRSIDDTEKLLHEWGIL